MLYPLFVEEPSVYLCNSIANGAHNSDVIPSVTNKCNMVSSPLPAFNRQSASDEYSPSIPNWDNRPSYLMNTSPSHYDHGKLKKKKRKKEKTNKKLVCCFVYLFQ